MECEIKRIEMPIPVPSLKKVNLYLVKSSENKDYTMIEAGFYRAQSLHYLLRYLRKTKTSFNDIEKIIITHFHVDHFSLAPLLKDLFDPTILMGEKEVSFLENNASDFVRGIMNFYRLHGVPEKLIEEMLLHHPLLKLSEVYEKYFDELDIKKLRDNDVIDASGCKLKVYEVPGHTPGHIVLISMNDNQAFLGDHILPKITPHIVPYDIDNDWLSLYLNSLNRVSKLKINAGWPGHREKINDVKTRISELLEHHQERLREILEKMKTNDTSFDIARKIKWRTRHPSWEEYPPSEKFFSLGEAIAHLEHLRRKGIIEAKEKKGIIHWRKNIES